MDGIKQNTRNEILRKKILDIEKIQIGKCPIDSPWVKPVRICYTQDGHEKVWDVVKSHDSVGIVVFNTTRKKLILVRQFRPAAYYACLPDKVEKINLKQYPPSLGLTLELCAGIVDKDKPLVEIARDELREECGYEAPASAFTKIVTYRWKYNIVSYNVNIKKGHKGLFTLSKSSKVFDIKFSTIIENIRIAIIQHTASFLILFKDIRCRIWSYQTNSFLCRGDR
uniref:uridine diphosphate glucose pyrophosphatase NUDT14-like isoform X1 n=1 Tax=Vespula vulgaris TaxID=7454 RepID=UPI00223B551C|nr:uridine diphosphate glucose pyrophosphatase NUDT14-like isoform X1 [Vespula vulgaris]